MKMIPFLILLVVVLGCGKLETSQQTTTPSVNETPIEVQASALTKAYDANEIAADGQYKGKLLSVSGTVTGISETFGTLQVDLEGHKDKAGIGFITVKCTFNEKEKQSIAALVKGSNATLIGRGDGMTAGLYAGLTDCKIK